MKSKLISLFFLLFFFSCSCNRATPEVRAYRRAVRFGAKAKLTLHVVDENGMSINGAKCHVGFSNMARTLRSVDGMSDEKGFFTAQGKAQWHIGGNVQKEGFYQQQFEFLDYGRMERLEKGRWMPWNPIITVELQERRNPIPMYVCHAGKDDERIKDLRFPYDVEIGFDCEKRDFISPYGEGVVTDFYVRISSIPMPDDIAKQMKDCLRLKREAGDDRTKQFYISQEFNHILITYHEFVLSVPDKDGGFIRKKKKMNKVLVSEYEAPLDGYTNSIRMIRENERGLDEYNPSDVTDEDYLIFKTRIVRNDEGEIISANYGKIYGPVEHFIDRWLESCRIGFVCYFNPEPNNRSIEFDEMNNLFYPQYKSSIFKP